MSLEIKEIYQIYPFLYTYQFLNNYAISNNQSSLKSLTLQLNLSVI